MKKFTLFAATALVSVTAWAKPDSPKNFKMQFDIVDGKPVVSGSFDCPTHTSGYDPKPLDNITGVKVTRGCSDVHEQDVLAYESSDLLAPGEHVEFTDKFGEFEYGYIYTYNVSVTAGEKDGNGNDIYSFGEYYRLYMGVQPDTPIVTYSRGDRGAAPVSISAVAPSTTKDGRPLTQPLTKLQFVIREDTKDVVKYEELSPEPGKTYTWVDENAENGSRILYYVYAVCEYGKSEQGAAYVYVGEDTPANPTDLEMVKNEDGSITLVWKAPENGMKEGFLDPESILYRVKRMGDAPATLAEDLKATTYTDPLDDVTGPTAVKYQIVAYNSIGEGGSAESPETIGGPTSYMLPFEENFNSGSVYYKEAEKKWSFVTDGYEANWEVTYGDWRMGYVGGVDSDDDSEDGFALSKLCYADTGDTDYMISFPIDFKKAEYPVISFYHLAKEGEEVLLTVGLGDDKEGENLFTFKPGDLHSGTDYEWKKLIVSAESAAGKEISIFFKTVLLDDSDADGVGVDKIVVADYPGVGAIKYNVVDGHIALEWEAPSNSYGETPDSYDVVVDGADPVNVSEPEYTFATSAERSGDAHKVSVRAVYGDVIGKYSPELEVNLIESGVSAVIDGMAAQVEYFDVSGMKVLNPLKGSTIIRRSIKADGSVKVDKIIVPE